MIELATASPAQQLFKQLSEDFPPHTARWVTGAGVKVLPVRRVPLAMIDFSNAKNWNAEEHPAKIKRFRQKMRDGTQKPILLVKRPGHKKMMVCDGHHRSIAARDEGMAPLAWVVVVRVENGPWDEMHAAQRGSQGGVKLATPISQTSQPVVPSQQQVPPGQVPPSDDQMVLIIAGVLATSAAAGVGVDVMAGYLQAYHELAALPRQAIEQALGVATAMPPEVGGISGAATRNIVRLNLIRRAQFVLNSARRFAAAMASGYARGDVAGALADQLTAERRYYGQQLQAGWNRMNAAAQVDSAASTLGLLLGWNTVLDARTSPECRAANRHNFRADIMPRIGYPGAVHPHCRCYPGPSWPGARLLA